MSSYAGAKTAEQQAEIRRAMKHKQKAGSGAKRQQKVEVNTDLLKNRGVVTCRCTHLQQALSRDKWDNFKDPKFIISFIEYILEHRFLICDAEGDTPVKSVFINKHGFRPNDECKFYFVMGVDLVITNDRDSTEHVVNFSRHDGQVFLTYKGVKERQFA